MNIHPYLLMSQQTQDGGPGLMANVVLFGSIIAIFYFMIIRPQQKRQKQHQAMLEALKKGDKVVVSSPSVPKPVAVRYGWASTPDVNLFDQQGLPATPFRTDVK